MNQRTLFATERQRFHDLVIEKLLVIDRFKFKSGPNENSLTPAASNADSENQTSRQIANEIANKLHARDGKRLPAQSSGDEFERAVSKFLDATFMQLGHLRPGKWQIRSVKGRSKSQLAEFEQYQHLKAIALAAKNYPEIAVALGNDYLIAPDVIVVRDRESDAEINARAVLVGPAEATAASLRQTTGSGALLHASISCKWTIRSDRAQNSRSEALNLVRNRKGRTPHIVVVTGEPLPSRLSSLALGTGDIDCVYHFALYELLEAVRTIGQSEAFDLILMMIEGKRLKDISDLPLDLAV